MLSPGDVLQDRYRIVRPIGVGGMGAVYEGENVLIRRRVAIKVMHGSSLRRPEMTARFEREAQIVNQIHSDHVVEVLDLGFLSSGDPFIVMEYLDGQTLSERIGFAGKMPAHQLVPLLCQVLRALEAAHRAGVVHRDIKPDNVFLLGADSEAQLPFVKLLDFGISKIGDNDGQPNLTVTGATIGTPAFMAPEQIGGGERVGPAADLYAVGVVLYRGLTGRPPFASDRINELLTQIGQGGATPIDQVDSALDSALSAIVEHAMHLDPEQRYRSADDMRKALTRWLRGAHPNAASHGSPDSYRQPLAQSTSGSPSVLTRTTPPSAQSSVAPAVRSTPTVPPQRWSLRQVSLAVIATAGLLLALLTRGLTAPDPAASSGSQPTARGSNTRGDSLSSTAASIPKVQVLPRQSSTPPSLAETTAVANSTAREAFRATPAAASPPGPAVATPASVGSPRAKTQAKKPVEQATPRTSDTKTSAPETSTKTANQKKGPSKRRTKQRSKTSRKQRATTPSPDATGKPQAPAAGQPTPARRVDWGY